MPSAEGLHTSEKQKKYTQMDAWSPSPPKKKSCPKAAFEQMSTAIQYQGRETSKNIWLGSRVSLRKGNIFRVFCRGIIPLPLKCSDIHLMGGLRSKLLLPNPPARRKQGEMPASRRQLWWTISLGVVSGELHAFSFLARLDLKRRIHLKHPFVASPGGSHIGSMGVNMFLQATVYSQNPSCHPGSHSSNNRWAHITPRSSNWAIISTYR